MAEYYTYRNGVKLSLDKSPDSFVVRATGDAVSPLGLGEGQRVSTASTRLSVKPGELEQKMAVARGISPSHHSYRNSETGADFLVTDRIYIRANSASSVDAVAAENGLLIVERLGDSECVAQLTDATGMNPVKLVVKLTEHDDRVELAENDLNYRMELSEFSVPVVSDGSYDRQWHLHGRSSSPQVAPIASSNCEAAWERLKGFGSPSVVIGVTDDGCRLDHQDFDSPNKFAGWAYFQGNRLVSREDIEADASQMYEPGANHGTACAGVAAAEVDGKLTVGAAPGCRLLPIKWPSSGASLFIGDLRLRRALDYLADKVDILSNSWGNPLDGSVGAMVQSRIEQLSTSGGRRGRGIVFLWAAGNENCPINHSGTVDIPYDQGVEAGARGLVWRGVSTARTFRHPLSQLPGVLYVGALASTGQRAHYSNYGTGLALCAPSSNGHTYLRMAVAGLGVTTASGDARAAVDSGFGGTSSATPLVAGIAALVISARPDISALEVVSVLKRSASKNLSLEGYPRTPPAAFDPDPSWDVSPVAPFADGAFRSDGQDKHGSWSPWFGYGKVDAEAAVSAVLGTGVHSFQASNESSVEIPDFNLVGARSSIGITRPGAIVSLAIDVDIRHTYAGDLRVALVSPSGEVVALQSQVGGSADDVRRSYTPADTPALGGLLGQELAGRWSLVVQDVVRRDRGELRFWEMRGQVQLPAV